ncbi:MAG: ribonuclease P protein component, partial [Okeania sp. SIO2H7]|nr:ribonuclease P protein component [Okeania sp. SIO2H7]
MLPKANRLRQNKDFSKIYKRGNRHSGKDLVLRGLRRSGKPEVLNALVPTRVGISIGKKVSKQAVERNRLKRLIRAAIRELLPKIK